MGDSGWMLWLWQIGVRINVGCIRGMDELERALDYLHLKILDAAGHDLVP